MNIHGAVTMSCGAIINDNNTYFVNPNYPSTYDGMDSCQITLVKSHPDVCQYRWVVDGLPRSKYTDGFMNTDFSPRSIVFSVLFIDWTSHNLISWARRRQTMSALTTNSLFPAVTRCQRYAATITEITVSIWKNNSPRQRETAFVRFPDSFSINASQIFFLPLRFSLHSVHRHGCRANKSSYSDVCHERQLVSAIVEGPYLADTMQHDLSRRGGLSPVLHWGFRSDKILQLRPNERIAIVKSGLQHMHSHGEEFLRDPIHGVCRRR